MTKRTIQASFKVRALDDFQSEEAETLCLKKGDMIAVKEIEALGKGYGSCNGKKGWFLLELAAEPGSPISGSGSPRGYHSPSGSPESSSPLSQSSPPQSRNMSRPKRLSSFLWKNKEERQHEVLGGTGERTFLAKKMDCEV